MSGVARTSMALPAAAHAVPDGRRFVHLVLSGKYRDEFIEAAAFLTSEVVTNVVLHARTPCTIVVTIDEDAVTVDVSDASPVRPLRRSAGAAATTGRGLSLLDEMASSWGVLINEGGKTVTFTLRTADDPWASAAAGNWPAELEL